MPASTASQYPIKDPLAGRLLCQAQESFPVSDTSRPLSSSPYIFKDGEK
jgi:hypothetical protein